MTTRKYNEHAFDVEGRYHLQLEAIESIMEDLFLMEYPSGTKLNSKGNFVRASDAEAARISFVPPFFSPHLTATADDNVADNVEAMLRRLAEKIVAKADEIAEAKRTGKIPAEFAKAFQVVTPAGEIVQEFKDYGCAHAFSSGFKKRTKVVISTSN